MATLHFKADLVVDVPEGVDLTSAEREQLRQRLESQVRLTAVGLRPLSGRRGYTTFATADRVLTKVTEVPE